MEESEGRRQHIENLLKKASQLRQNLDGSFSDRLVSSLYKEASHIAESSVIASGKRRASWDVYFDRIATHPLTGFPLMFLMLAAIFWITIEGANYPSELIAKALFGFEAWASNGFQNLGSPDWLTGFLWHGVWRGLAWVVSVMLPPMAIFFPMFTLLEDFGYLPRIAFNLDNLFRKSGAHGKQALTMSMGYGCNAAGVIATRIIDSPRERLIAIITNNFSLCNGRWPTQILIASVFFGAVAPPALAGITSAMVVVAVALLGVFLTFLTSWLLSRTILKGQASAFSLELPPYRPPRILQTLYTSLIDRTIFVLWRAVVFAVPAGAVIWLISNIHLGDASIAEHFIRLLDPVGFLIGLNGVILLAYIIAIPANEIIIPTVLMLTALSLNLHGVGEGAGVLFELADENAYMAIFQQAGWTLLTAVNLMLFSLVHNPCSTTIYTIYKETGSAKWTAVATFLPLGMGFALCFLVAQFWRLFAG